MSMMRRVWGIEKVLTWSDQRTAPSVPNTLAIMGLSMLVVE